MTPAPQPLRPLAWYEARDAHQEIAALLRWLNARGELHGVDGAIYVAEKPWKWDEEYWRMVSDEAEAA